jgi:zinc transport system permease protein
MGEFLDAVSKHSFLQMAVLTCLAASISCGVIGSFVVVRRISSIAGGIAHCVLGGLGAAEYLRAVYGWSWMQPLYGAIAAALLAAAIIAVVSLRASEREDTVISALWAIGMAAGVLFISQTPGYRTDLVRYLFGDLLLVSGTDVWLMAALDVLIIVIAFLAYPKLLAVCFDEEFARLRGVRVEAYYVMLLALVALTVVVLMTVVGLILVIALLALPVAVAGQFSRRLWQMMVIACILTTVFTSAGLVIGYDREMPPGAVAVLLAGGVYVCVLLGRRVWPQRA